MPRPNQPRSIASEEALARRIAHEREARGMSYDGLASRMTKAGCPIQPSGLYKIEKAGRRITVDELVALSQVFNIPVDRLLLPPEAVTSEELTNLVLDWDKKREKAQTAAAEEAAAWHGLREFLEANPHARAQLEKVLSVWVEHYFEEDRRESVLPYWMWKATGDPEWGERAKRALDEEVGI